MRTRIVALLLAILAMPLTAAFGHPPTDEAPELKVAQIDEEKPCPTGIEIQPYISIEPTTGVEYRVLHLHCPGEEDSQTKGRAQPGRDLYKPPDCIHAVVRRTAGYPCAYRVESARRGS